MALHPPVLLRDRPRRGIWLLTAALCVSALVGCSQRRTSFRPVFMSPRFRANRPVLMPNDCPSGNCGSSSTTVIPGGTTIESGTISSPSDSSVVPSPSLDSGFPSLEAPTSSSDSGFPRLDEPVSPASNSPPRPNVTPSEPPLELTPAQEGTPSAEPGPRLDPEKGAVRTSPSSTRSGRRSLFGGRPREASLREKLRPFVNDPEDLFSPPKADRPWKYVVIHHSAQPTGGLDAIDHEHRKVLGWQGCGYHFVIGNGTGSPDGQIEVAQRWSNQQHGVHCRDGKDSEVNEYGIGICLVGDLDASPPSERQIEATRFLVDYLTERYRVTSNHVGTHASLANSPTACPGKHFPTQAVLGSRDTARRQ